MKAGRLGKSISKPWMRHGWVNAAVMQLEWTERTEPPSPGRVAFSPSLLATRSATLGSISHRGGPLGRDILPHLTTAARRSPSTPAPGGEVPGEPLHVPLERG